MWKTFVVILTSPIVGRSRSEKCDTASAAFDVAHPQTTVYAAEPKPDSGGRGGRPLSLPKGEHAPRPD
jgi:hypothetical protein